MTDVGTTLTPPRTTPDGNGRGARRIRRRPGLPGGRAVVGGFLVALAAVGTFAAYTTATAGPDESYVVADRDLPAGVLIERGDLRRATVDLPSAQRGRAFTDVDVLVGATTLGPVGEGELIQSSSVTKSGGEPGGEEVALLLDSSAVLGGRVKSGERIDVFATYGTGASAVTIPVVVGAPIVRVDDAGGSLTDQDRYVLTLGVDSAAVAIAVAHAQNAGEITIARSAVGGDAEPPAPYSPSTPGAG